MQRPILRPPPLRAAAFVTALIAGMMWGGLAQAKSRCWVPMTQWQPRDAVARLAEQNGWTVRRIKIDDGCYEVIGTDANGRKIEVKLHPGTLVLVEYEEDDDDHPRKGKHKD